MAKDVFDLVVRMENVYASFTGYISSGSMRMAYKQGVLSGLDIGLCRLEVDLDLDKEALLAILMNQTLPLNEVVYRANTYLPVGKFFLKDLFQGEKYRRSAVSEFYAKGVKTGFLYVFELFESCGGYGRRKETRTNLVKFHIERVKKEIEKI